MGNDKFSSLAMKVMEKRYLRGETPEEMFTRVAKHATSSYEDNELAQYWALEYYTMMSKLDFLPNSPTLMNAGRPLGQLSACFVLPVEDDMIGICDAVKNQAIIHKSGGGTGFSFSRLRPSGAKVASTQGAASGPISFMQVFNAMTETVKQGGMRRGANMGMLHVWHPDIEQFVDAKVDKTQLTNFNISVAITDEFMKAVEAGERFRLYHEKLDTGVPNTVDAKALFRKIAHNAWLNGEPGVVFIDNINSKHPLPDLIESTNPCGEQPLLPNESCNLGSINLGHFVSGGSVDWARLEETVRIAVRFLDDVIDVNLYPLDIISRMTLATRKVGLGVMGWADMLILLGLRYDSEEAVRMAYSVSQFIQTKAYLASAELAEERGAYPRWVDDERSTRGWKPLRNATVTTIAPTGTLSIIANCSGGVEPVFAFEMDRGHIDETNRWVHPLWERRAELGLKEEVFVKSRDVHWSWLIKHQAAWQQNVCNAVSMTINMASSVSVEDVQDAYMMAWKAGCKGLTVYRDGSRDGQILKDASEKKPEFSDPIDQMAVSMPKVDSCVEDQDDNVVMTGCNGCINIIDWYEGNPICRLTYEETAACKQSGYQHYFSLHNLPGWLYGGKVCRVGKSTVMITEPLRAKTLQAKGKSDPSILCTFPNGDQAYLSIDVLQPVKLVNGFMESMEGLENRLKWSTNQFMPKPRPKRAYGFTDEVQVGCGKLFITFNRDQNGAALETFIETGKTGGCAAQSSAMGQLISVALRSGVRVNELVKRLKGIKCPACVNKGLGVLSCPDAVARVLVEENALKINLRNDGKVRVEKPDSGDIGGNSCPECGKATVPSGGCVTCPECGWSKCG